MLGSFILYLYDKNRSYNVSFIFDVSSSALSSVTNYLLFYKIKGHGSGCTTGLSQRNAQLSLLCVLSKTTHLPVQLQYTKQSQINSAMDSKTMTASKIIGQCWHHTKNFDLSLQANKHVEIGYHIWHNVTNFSNPIQKLRQLLTCQLQTQGHCYS